MFPVEHFRPQNGVKTAQNAKNAAEVFLLAHSCGIINPNRAPAHPGRQYNTTFCKEDVPMAKVVAIANQKGGVGKTATCVNLSSCVAALGKRVLVVDLDPQGNTSSGYGVSKHELNSNVYTCLIDDEDVRQAIVKTNYNADLLPPNTQLAGAAVELVNLTRRENRLRSVLAPVVPVYDYIFIDCPPSLDLLTVNGLCACDTVLIPIQCEYYALEGLSELMNTLKTVRKKYNKYLDIEGVLFTMYAGRLNLTMQVVAQVKKYYGTTVL